MIGIFTFIVCLFISLGVSSPMEIDNSCKLISKLEFIQKPVVIDTLTQVEDTVLLQYMTVKQFKDILGKHESANTYNITNRWGFMGKYQFSPYMVNRFSKIEYAGPNMELVKARIFLRNPEIQERAMTRVCKHYIWYIYKYGYTKYINQEIGGIVVTMESLMLGCHFSPAFLHAWLTSKGTINYKDALGTSIRDYMKKFESKGILEPKLTLVCHEASQGSDISTTSKGIKL